MRTRKTLLQFLAVAVGVFVFAAISLAHAATSAEEIPNSPRKSLKVRPSEIRGTIMINGWTGDASNIRVYAIPGDVVSPDGTQPERHRPSRERTAVPKRTSDPNLFTFSIKGLVPRRAYRLGIKLPLDSTGPKVFWRGLMGGIAMSGAPPVAVEGFVARTEVEILDKDGNWVGADNLQFNDPETALRTLRWRSSIPGTVAGELQISTRAFPIKGEFGPCDEPEEGIIYRRELPVGRSGEWLELDSLDFAQILRQGRRVPADGLTTVSFTGDEITTMASPADVSAISERDLQMLSMGAPLYLRIVPITGRGRACDAKKDGVHGWVILAKLPKSVLENSEPPPSPAPADIEPFFQLYTPPVLRKFPDGQVHPTMKGDSTYYVIKDHRLPPCRSWEYGHSGKWPCAFYSWPGATWKYNELTQKWYLVNQYDPLGQIMLDSLTWVQPNQLFKKGDVFTFVWVYSSGSCSGFCLVGEVFTGLVTAAVNGFGDFVTYLAESFESIKDGVATVVADVITFLPVIGDACNLVTSCKNVIKFGIETGLASMGLPPSLPNWEELKAQGMDYLAAEIATEMASATGLPEEVTKLGADATMQLAKDMAQKTIDAMTKNRGSGNGEGYDWVLPYTGMDPAVWKIWIKKKEGVNLPSNLYLRTKGLANFFDLFASPNPFSDNLYVPAEVHLPTEFPSSNVVMVPIVLQPDFSTIPPPKCFGYPVACVPSPNNIFNIPLCYYNFNPSKPVDCKFFGSNYLGVYYRDHWIDNRLDTFSSCLYLQASAGTKKSSFDDFIKQLTDPLFDPWLPYYPPFYDFAAIKAKELAVWAEPFYWAPECNEPN